MKLFEIDQLQTDDLKFDLVDDALFFMRNDPVFYRKEYFPTMSSLSEYHRQGSQYDPEKIINPLINKGIVSYCKKFNLSKYPDEIFKQDHRRSLLDKIYQEEIEEIDKGNYL